MAKHWRLCPKCKNQHSGLVSCEEQKSLPKRASVGSTPEYRFIFRDLFVTRDIPDPGPKVTLDDRMSDQLLEILDAYPDTYGWMGHPEMPPPPSEVMDTYAVAWSEAVRHCEHPNSTSTIYAQRERQCDDCGRYFRRKEWYER